MKKRSFAKFGQAFFEVLFLRLRSDNVQQLGWLSRAILYFLASALFYGPICYFVVVSSISNHSLVIYYLALGALHVLSKFMLYNSKRLQQRFSTMKTQKRFLYRIFLMVEYISFMWLVYLFYPLACILFPISLLGMSFESILGYNVLLNLFLQNPEQFIMVGGIASYIIFILADGYKKIRTGFLPDYLGIYALLSAISASVEGSTRYVFEYLNINMNSVSSVLSKVFALANSSMSIVASAMTVFFALFSLYNSCGTPAEESMLPRISINSSNDSPGTE